MPKRWTPEEDELLKSIYPDNTKKTILSRISKDWMAILRRARRLNLHRNPDLINLDRTDRGPRKDSWNPEEEQILREMYSNCQKEEILKRINRSWDAVFGHARKLGLKRNEEYVHQMQIENSKKAYREDYWSKEEDDLIREIYENNIKKDIIPKFKNRSWQAIRIRAIKLGICRNPELIKKDNISATIKGVLKKTNGKYQSFFKDPEVQKEIRKINKEKRGVEYPTQDPEVREKIRKTVQERYGVDNVFQNEEIKKKIEETNKKIYEHKSPMQDKSIKAKAAETARERGSLPTSYQETQFYEYLIKIDDKTEHQVMHPIARHVIDFYLPSYDLWIQFDGDYWHGRYFDESSTGSQSDNIRKKMANDIYQNRVIPNLVRFWASDVEKAIKSGQIMSYVKEKVLKKAKKGSISCFQYRRKMDYLEEDLKTLDFNPSDIKSRDFVLQNEKMSSEISEFIKRYEWLGTVGTNPKWCFTARYKGNLGGVVLINEPASYSKILGDNTMKYEATIQRGATISWAPKNLGSRLIKFSCKWMVKNTDKRLFTSFADPRAQEIGTIYQACNFDYLGDNFGSAFIYRHPQIRNGVAFSAQNLKRTSAFKKWCKENGIIAQPEWFKENGFKKISAIPSEIKEQWYNSINNILKESEKISTGKKHKYVLVIGGDKREQRFLNSLKKYRVKEYPKRKDVQKYTPDPDTKFFIPQKVRRVVSISRQTPEKHQFIIENYANMTQQEIADHLNETKRWVERQVKVLVRNGKLQTKHGIGSTKSRKSEEKINYIIQNHGLKTKIEMAEELEETVRWVKRQINNLYKDGKLKK